MATVIGLQMNQQTAVPLAEATLDGLHQMFRERNVTCTLVVEAYMQAGRPSNHAWKICVQD